MSLGHHLLGRRDGDVDVGLGGVDGVVGGNRNAAIAAQVVVGVLHGPGQIIRDGDVEIIRVIGRCGVAIGRTGFNPGPIGDGNGFTGIDDVDIGVIPRRSIARDAGAVEGAVRHIGGSIGGDDVTGPIRVKFVSGGKGIDDIPGDGRAAAVGEGYRHLAAAGGPRAMGKGHVTTGIIGCRPDVHAPGRGLQGRVRVTATVFGHRFVGGGRCRATIHFRIKSHDAGGAHGHVSQGASRVRRIGHEIIPVRASGAIGRRKARRHIAHAGRQNLLDFHVLRQHAAVALVSDLPFDHVADVGLHLVFGPSGAFSVIPPPFGNLHIGVAGL